MTEHARLFSATYADARARFLEAASAVGAETRSYRLEVASRDELALDVALVGPAAAPAVVVSSGVHGVEGFFGSAVQRGLLDRLRQSPPPPRLRYVLVHAVNPFGFSHLRRANEDNVDLNRNFLERDDAYVGAPPGYAELDGLLNPPSPPARWDPFPLKAAWTILRLGRAELTESIASGQYTHPRGLFFGGHGPSRSAQIVRAHCDAWLDASPEILHLDLHSGLGPFARHALRLESPAGSVSHRWSVDAFGAARVETVARGSAEAYAVSGSFGGWMRAHFSPRRYHAVTAEFGTFPVIRVVAALRAENRAHHHGTEGTAAYAAAKAELLECFCPADPGWRRTVVGSALDIVAQGARALTS